MSIGEANGFRDAELFKNGPKAKNLKIKTKVNKINKKGKTNTNIKLLEENK